MLQANLYIDRIDLARYLTPEEVRQSFARDAGELAARLQNGALKPNGLPLFPPLVPKLPLGNVIT